MSKGSKRRPTFVSMDEVDSNWDLAFGKKDESKKCCKNKEGVCKCKKENNEIKCDSLCDC